MEKMDTEVNGRGSNRTSALGYEEEHRVRREEEGSQAENLERSQDPGGHVTKDTLEGSS